MSISNDPLLRGGFPGFIGQIFDGALSEVEKLAHGVAARLFVDAACLFGMIGGIATIGSALLAPEYTLLTIGATASAVIPVALMALYRWSQS